MGIIKLNAFLDKKTTNSITKLSLYQLRDRTMAVDYSIYYYKFKKSRGDNDLISSLKKQIETFKLFNIHPIYIFDGKPNNNKFDILKNRNKEINRYKEKIKTENNINLIKKYEKKIVKLNSYEISLCKKLFQENEIEYIQAKGEADDLCCKMFKEKLVYGIFTEDNDLLLGGANIYKGLNNHNDTVFEYNLLNILNELGLSYNDFLKICLLSGSSYTKKISNIFKLYEDYKQSKFIYINRYKDKEILYNKWVNKDLLNNTITIK